MRGPIELITALAVVAVAVLGAVACSSESSDRRPVTEESATGIYCADLVELMGLLDGGGTVTEYNALLAEIVDESPAGHGETWALMLTLSEEPFTYENFNPAVDALDRLDLDGTCPGPLERLVVDDSGRVRRG